MNEYPPYSIDFVNFKALCVFVRYSVWSERMDSLVDSVIMIQSYKDYYCLQAKNKGTAVTSRRRFMVHKNVVMKKGTQGKRKGSFALCCLDCMPWPIWYHFKIIYLFTCFSTCGARFLTPKFSDINSIGYVLFQCILKCYMKFSIMAFLIFWAYNVPLRCV